MSSIQSKIITLAAPKTVVVKIEEINIQKLKANQFVAETIFTAISPGTETAAYLGVEPLRAGNFYPRVVGYCNVAKIIFKGTEVNNVNVDDYILTFQSHRTHFVLASNDFYIKLNSNNLKSKTAAYLFHLGYHSIISAGLSQQKLKIAVIGAGVLGYTTALMAKINGHSVSVFSNQNQAIPKLIDSNFEFYKKDIESIKSQINNFNCVINTSNTWQDWHIALQITALAGQIVNLGFPGRGQSLPDFNPLDPKFVYAKNIVIKPLCKLEEDDGSDYCIRKNLQYILNLIEDSTLNGQDLFTNEIEYNLIEKQYQSYENRSIYQLSTLIHWKN